MPPHTAETPVPPDQAAVAPDIRWPAAILEANPIAAADAFDRAIHGLARRLPPADAARFLFALDSALYARLGAAAIRAEQHRDDQPHPKHRLTRYHDFFLDRVSPGERIADLGCGLGVLATHIAQHCRAHVVGVDMSAPNVAAARALTAAAGIPAGPGTGSASGSVVYAVANILDLAAGAPCPELAGPFGAVILSNVLEHLPDRPRVLRALFDRLRPARLLLRVPAFERDWRVPYKRELGVEWRLDPTHEIEHTREELAGELLAAGLRIDSLLQQWGEYYAVVLPAS